MLIFDRFQKREQAEEFAAAVKERFGRETYVFDSQEAANESDPFPFALDGYIVHVERDYDHYEVEDEILPFVRDFGGVFAGT